MQSSPPAGLPHSLTDLHLMSAVWPPVNSLPDLPYTFS
jgi:hypothetical protein